MYDVDSLSPMAQKASVVHTFLRMASYRHPQMKRTMDPKQTHISTKLLQLKSSFSFSWHCYTSNNMHANVGMSMSESHTTKDCSMDVEHLYNVLSSICPLPLMDTWIASGTPICVPVPIPILSCQAYTHNWQWIHAVKNIIAHYYSAFISATLQTTEYVPQITPINF